MKITVLCENFSGRWTRAEHGLSLHIEDGGEKILFDTGSTDVFKNNANYLGVEVDSLPIVLSHGHDDHMGGLRFLQGNNVLAHSGIFTRRFRKRDDSEMDLIYERHEMESRFNLTLSDEPLRVSENIFFLGEVPRLNDFEAKTTPFYLEGGDDDFVMDDSGIAIVTEKGLVVISGCAHAGICNTVEQAIAVTGVDRVFSVMGGFHLLDRGEVTVKTVEYFQEKGLNSIYPCHCSVFSAMSYIYEKMPYYRIKTGDVIEF